MKYKKNRIDEGAWMKKSRKYLSEYKLQMEEKASKTIKNDFKIIFYLNLN